jgi:hypothetical protein
MIMGTIRTIATTLCRCHLIAPSSLRCELAERMLSEQAARQPGLPRKWS